VRFLDRLSALRIPIAAVTEMDRLVNLDAMTPRQAARAWLEDNPAIPECWDG
jgi:glycine betaine/proline transport system substrate-binding protein